MSCNLLSSQNLHDVNRILSGVSQRSPRTTAAMTVTAAARLCLGLRTNEGCAEPLLFSKKSRAKTIRLPAFFQRSRILSISFFHGLRENPDHGAKPRTVYCSRNARHSPAPSLERGTPPWLPRASELTPRCMSRAGSVSPVSHSADF